MAKIIKFAEVIKKQPTKVPKMQTLLSNYVRCLSEIDKVIENHFKKTSCP
jgi:hypothetical protein